MASAQHTDDELFDEFLSAHGHDTTPAGWDHSYNKKQCPECGGIHDDSAQQCGVCGWFPER